MEACVRLACGCSSFISIGRKPGFELEVFHHHVKGHVNSNVGVSHRLLGAFSLLPNATLTFSRFPHSCFIHPFDIAIFFINPEDFGHCFGHFKAKSGLGSGLWLGHVQIAQHPLHKTMSKSI